MVRPAGTKPLSKRPRSTFLIETPEQLRALAEPLRQRLLRQFARPSTIKEAAARLGEPVTRLYHHVDQLCAAGLIAVVAEQRRRAAVERTFQAVATTFAVSPLAFGAGEKRAAKREAIARAALEEILAGTVDEEGAFRMMRARVRLGAEGLRHLETGLAELLEKHRDDEAPEVEIALILGRQG